MFSSTEIANPDTSNWDTSAVTTMYRMFDVAKLANPDTSNWDTSAVTDMSGIFRLTRSANPDVSNWDTSNVTNMSSMFNGAMAAHPTISNWDVSLVTNMLFMITGFNLPTSEYDNALINFSAQNLQSNVNFYVGDSVYCSTEAQSARNLMVSTYGWTITDGGACNTNNDFVFSIRTDIAGGTSTDFRIDTSGGGYNYNVDCNDDGVFEGLAQTGNYTCDYSVTGVGNYTIRINDNTGQGTGYTRAMFNAADVRHKIVSIDQWGSSQWSNMNKAFNDCDVLTINATDVPDLSNVSDFRLMFSGATLANPNTSNWDMSSAVDIAGMFRNTNMATPNTNAWDTSAVQDMSFMFNGATAANPLVANWDTSMVANMSNMFSGATSANPNIKNWNVSAVTDMTAILNGLTLPTSEYDAILTNFSVQNLNSNVVFGAGNSIYCSTAAIDARNILTTTYGWNISDGGQCIPEEIFANGFESNVVVFKSSDSMVLYDFSEVEALQEGEEIRLIAIGLDDNNQVTIKVDMRQFDGLLQIRQSYLSTDFDGEQLWTDGLWQDVYEELSEINLW